MSAVAPYGRRWRKARAIVLERDGWRCQLRGERCTGVASQVDHIDRDPANHALENLRASCAWCNITRANRGRAHRDPGWSVTGSLAGRAPRAVP